MLAAMPAFPRRHLLLQPICTNPETQLEFCDSRGKVAGKQTEDASTLLSVVVSVLPGMRGVAWTEDLDHSAALVVYGVPKE